MNKLIVLLAIILLTSCVSTKEVQKESGICVTTDKTDSEPSIIISSGKCAKDE